MDQETHEVAPPRVYEEPPTDDKHLLAWLEVQDAEKRLKLGKGRLDMFIRNAAQPRHVSGNACIRLCYFIEQCKNSMAVELRHLAFDKDTILGLFNFYIEWNEKNQNRSLRQVLELISTLISRNPDEGIKVAAKTFIIQRNIAIITRQAAQPLVKPAIKSLECFLSKGTISADNIIGIYRNQTRESVLTSDRIAENTIETSWDSFFSEVFDWMTYPDISPAAGKFLVTMFREMRTSSATIDNQMMNHTISWQRWIRRAIYRDPEVLENIKNYLFPPLFKLDRPGSLLFLQELNKEASPSNLLHRKMDTQFLLRLAAIEVGKRAGLVEEPTMIYIERSNKKAAAVIVMNEDTIGPLLLHASETVRSLAFSVLVSSGSSIRPFSPFVLEVLQSSLGVLYADVDAKFRNEVFSNTKQMIERLRGATAFLTREVASLSFQLEAKKGEPETRVSEIQKAFKAAKELLHEHKSFLWWYLEFLLGEMTPTASYQRHVTTLRVVNLLLRSGLLEKDSSMAAPQIADNATIWPFSVNFFKPAVVRLLMDLLLDPFEDVRAHAAMVLKLSSPVHFEEKQCLIRASSAEGQNGDQGGVAQPLGILNKFIKKAVKAADSSGRADYADGVAHSYDLLYSLQSSAEARVGLLVKLVESLEERVAIAEKDLSLAVLEAPIHGTCASLNCVWEGIEFEEDFRQGSSGEVDIHTQLNDLQIRIVESCFRIWKAVRDILCNDSPEGHLPQDLDEADDIDTKDVLSYSFRAVHESSNLMRVLANKIDLRAIVQDSPQQEISFQLLTRIGDLTYSQISSLRHRGAFSTVSLTFVAVCKLTQHFSWKNTGAEDLLHQWYKGALSCLDTQTSTTRRSAGLPALITAIISANSQDPTPDKIISELKARAVRPVNTDAAQLPQVHAINSLREIIKSSTLGKKNEKLITDCLEIAAQTLDSEVWAIRNVGLLLLRSLIDVLFGTSDSKASIEAGWDGHSIRISYDKFPDLQRLLLKLLSPPYNTHTTNNAVESVIPALDILRRAGPPPDIAIKTVELVFEHLGSRSWIVRELAANTMAALMIRENWLDCTQQILGNPSSSTNHRHGVLLTVKAIIIRARDNPFSGHLKQEERIYIEPADNIVDVLFPLLAKHELLDTQEGIPLRIAHLDLFNFAALLLLARLKGPEKINSKAFIKFDVTATKHYFINDSDARSFPSLGNAIIRRAVLATAIRQSHDELRHVLKVAMKIDLGTTEVALDCIDEAWTTPYTSGFAVDVCSTLAGVAISARYSEAKAKATTVLLALLRKAGPRASRIHSPFYAPIVPLYHHLIEITQNSGTAMCSTLILRLIQLSGWSTIALLCEADSRASNHNKYCFAVIQAFAETLHNAFDEQTEPEYCFAVSHALLDFFTSEYVTTSPATEGLLSCLLVIFRVLQHDDSEIREIGARIVSKIIDSSTCALAASTKLAHHILATYGNSPRLHSLLLGNIISQMIGASALYTLRMALVLPDVSEQIKFALGVDTGSTLFTKEEQNLFVDRVRDSTLWIETFKRLPLPRVTAKSSAIGMLVRWVRDGLTFVLSLSGPEADWAANAKVQVVLLRLVRCALAVLDFDEYNVKGSRSGAPGQEWEEQVREITRQLGVFWETKRTVIWRVTCTALLPRRAQLLSGQTLAIVEEECLGELWK